MISKDSISLEVIFKIECLFYILALLVIVARLNCTELLQLRTDVRNQVKRMQP